MGQPSSEARIRQRQRVLLACSAPVLFFALADAMAVRGLPATALVVRLAWAALLISCALALPRIRDPLRWVVTVAIAVGSCGAYALVAHYTGGSRGPMFSWSLALPLAIATVFQEDRLAAACGAISMWFFGMAVMLVESAWDWRSRRGSSRAMAGRSTRRATLERALPSALRCRSRPQTEAA